MSKAVNSPKAELVIEKAYVQSPIKCLGKVSTSEISDANFRGINITKEDDCLRLEWESRVELVPLTNIKNMIVKV